MILLQDLRLCSDKDLQVLWQTQEKEKENITWEVKQQQFEIYYIQSEFLVKMSSRNRRCETRSLEERANNKVLTTMIKEHYVL